MKKDKQAKIKATINIGSNFIKRLTLTIKKPPF